MSETLITLARGPTASAGRAGSACRSPGVEAAPAVADAEGER